MVGEHNKLQIEHCLLHFVNVGIELLSHRDDKACKLDVTRVCDVAYASSQVRDHHTNRKHDAAQHDGFPKWQASVYVLETAHKTHANSIYCDSYRRKK